MVDILGFDNPCMDFLCHLPHLPAPNESIPMHAQSWQGGGKVASGVVAAARLGACTALAGVLGDDIFGRFCKNDLMRHGVNVAALHTRANCSTSLSLVLSDAQTGGRNILYRQGNAPHLSPADLPAELLSQANILHLAHVDETTLTAARIARQNGTLVLFDADNYSPGMEAIYPLTDILIASEFMYRHAFKAGSIEKNLETALSWGPSVVLYTFGEKGCVGMWEKGFFRQAAFPVKTVDTVGAGDVFHGAFAACISRGMTPPEAARFSSAVSAIKCTRIGGRAGIPNRETTEHFMRTGEILSQELDERVKFYERGLENVIK